MSAAPRSIECDFIALRRPRAAFGLGLLILGVAFLAVVLGFYETLNERRAGLALDLAGLRDRQTPVVNAKDTSPSPGLRFAAEDLATPWTLLLAELEKASNDNAEQVAVLGVAPDHTKHSVLIIGEARNLALALAYVKRLQASRSIQYPMLDRHELRVEDPQHPIRFEITGQWRDQP